MEQHTDITTKFVFEAADIRGETVCLDQSYGEAMGNHHYPEEIARLLGEFLAAVTLLSTTIKFAGTLTLQATSDRGLKLVMAQCTSEQEIRAIVRGYEDVKGDSFSELLGGGKLAITIEPRDGQRYQSLVELTAGSLAAALESYFAQSEQLFTRLWLASNRERCGGLLLQQLPAQLAPDPVERQQQWEHVCHLASTVADEELLELSADELLYRLYHQDQVRRFDACPVSFRCNCSRERTAKALITLPRVELEDILMSDGVISMNCEFCNTDYQFDTNDVSRLFNDPNPELVH